MKEELNRIGQELLNVLGRRHVIAIYSGIPGIPEVEFQITPRAFDKMFGDDYTVETPGQFPWKVHYEGKIKYICAHE